MQGEISVEKKVHNSFNIHVVNARLLSDIYW